MYRLHSDSMRESRQSLQDCESHTHTHTHLSWSRWQYWWVLAVKILIGASSVFHHWQYKRVKVSQMIFVFMWKLFIIQKVQQLQEQWCESVYWTIEICCEDLMNSADDLFLFLHLFLYYFSIDCSRFVVCYWISSVSRTLSWIWVHSFHYSRTIHVQTVFIVSHDLSDIILFTLVWYQSVFMIVSFFKILSYLMISWMWF